MVSPGVTTRTIHINVFGVLFFFLTVAAGYMSYKLWPVYTKKTELEAMVKQKTYQLKRSEPQDVKNSILNTAKKNLGLELNPDDVLIKKYDTYVQIDVTWRPLVHLVFGRTFSWPIAIEQRVGIFD